MINEKLIVALDFPEKKQALELIEKLNGVCNFFKIGMELGLRVDDEFISSLVKKGKKIFLDYKYHDIGNTVEGAVKNAAALGIYMLTVHGEKQVIEAAAKGKKGTATKVFAVTVLTSLGEDYASQYGCSIKDLVLRRASYANEFGADGVISSPNEASIIRSQFPRLEICTPGIRPAGADKGDQNRTATPAEAIKLGANYIVVGRPITQSKDPVAAAKSIIAELA
jgi:orotidine-5'-phosphate decarboxylase